ncbi:MAG TPA: hypothetical protein VF552_12700 [Allosphingosinicella sp.]|jgi:hypothetical protein
MRAAAPALAMLAGACSALDLPDEKTHERRSPDGSLIARAWCDDGCDVPSRRTITIAAATEGESRGDEAGRIYFAEADDARLHIEWTAPRTLTVAGDCLSDGNYEPLGPWRAGEVEILPVRLPGAIACLGAR